MFSQCVSVQMHQGIGHMVGYPHPPSDIRPGDLPTLPADIRHGAYPLLVTSGDNHGRRPCSFGDLTLPRDIWWWQLKLNHELFTSGRYASDWNAVLLKFKIVHRFPWGVNLVKIRLRRKRLYRQ